MPEEQALFTGDLILAGSTTVIPEEDGDLGAVPRLAPARPAPRRARIYSAHGPVIEDAAGKIQEYLDHRMLRERQILEALGAGATRSRRSCKAIYADVPVALARSRGQSVHSHLKKLRQEGRVTEQPSSGSPSRWTLA